MTTKHDELADRARPALIIAAMRRSVLTYGELGKAVGLSGVELRNDMRHVLDEVARRCIAAKEPSLAVLVVNQKTGKPGQGFSPGYKDWHAEAQECFRHWKSPA
ncbi:MAG: hypothetical protein JWO11_892 [Nocardioides sp.]|nr:hypothetical protein [Nocardioides sp.]